mmetsp:Transcript_130478/g.225617  ORF Transcript_130478/g.225617 Transcript_130478/m.225617 type:complete len:209 (+) Transcript_130478:3330-3956(+)
MKLELGSLKLEGKGVVFAPPPHAPTQAQCGRQCWKIAKSPGPKTQRSGKNCSISGESRFVGTGAETFFFIFLPFLEPPKSDSASTETLEQVRNPVERHFLPAGVRWEILEKKKVVEFRGDTFRPPNSVTKRPPAPGDSVFRSAIALCAQRPQSAQKKYKAVISQPGVSSQGKCEIKNVQLCRETFRSAKPFAEKAPGFRNFRSCVFHQ